MSSFKKKEWILPQNQNCNIIDDIIQKRFPEYSEEDIQNFLNPKIVNLAPNPFHLYNSDAFAKAIAAASKIGIFVDYDVDGVSSGAMWSIFFNKISKDHIIYFPNRSDGYGPSHKSIDYFRQNHCDLILFLDCGTSAVDVITPITDMKICILDHHKPGNHTVQNAIIVNPYLSQQSDFYNLCTAGLSFLMIGCVDKLYNTKLTMTLLDLAALGTIADCMPLIGVNRAYIKRGLEIIQTNARPGIKALLILMKKNMHSINASTLGYYISSALNAAGRLDTSKTAFDLLVETQYDRARETAQTLINFNDQRKKIESDILSQAEHQVQQDQNCIIVRGDDWHPGVVGIIAGRLKEAYNKTTFAFYKKDNAWHGSARSSGHDLSSIIANGIVDNIIAYGGGHHAAAGLCVNDAVFDEWIQWCQDTIAEYNIDDNNHKLYIDYILDVYDIFPNIRTLSPFGYGNPNVLMLIKGLILKYVTQYGEHLKLSFANYDKSYFAFRCASSWGKDLTRYIGNKLDIVVSCDELSGFIEDIMLSK